MNRKRTSIAVFVVVLAGTAAFALGSAYARGTAGQKLLKKGAHFAAVGQAGQTTEAQKSKTVVNAQHDGTGIYTVNLTGAVSARCALTATQGNPSAAAAPNTVGHVTVGMDPGDTQAVMVKTLNIAGAAADRAFHVIIAC